MEKKHKKILITQSNYIPWKGYFDAIQLVDEFVIYDSVQYTKRDWRNRNKIRTPQGIKWLSIPIETKGKYTQAIDETKISDLNWTERHWSVLKENYKNASCFTQMESLVKGWYEKATFSLLSEINHFFITELCKFLSIKTIILSDREYELIGDPNERLVNICKQANATDYYTGLTAKNYINETQFAESGVALYYLDYSGYKEYPQLFGTFEHGVSIMDLLFNTGKEAPKFLKHIGNVKQR